MRKIILLLVALFIGVFGCSSKLAGNQEFEAFIKKFKDKPLPFYIHNRDSFRVYDEIILKGSTWVDNGYSKIEKGFLPNFPETANEAHVKYRALFEFKTQQSFRLVLIVRELDSENDHFPGLGKWLYLCTYGSSGNFIDTLTLANLKYNIQEKFGSVEKDLIITTKSFSFINDPKLTSDSIGFSAIETNSKYKLDASGRFNQLDSKSKKGRYKSVEGLDGYFPINY